MNGLILTVPSQSKDMKQNVSKELDLQDNSSNEDNNFFAQLIEDLVEESSDNNNKSLLLGKLLHLSSDIPDMEENEAVVTDSSQNQLLIPEHNTTISLEELIKVASFLKNPSNDLTNLPTNSQTLKTALLDLETQNLFKESKTVKNLLDIAKNKGIEVTNFQFFTEETPLDTHTKTLIQKINSEDIFKLIEKKSLKEEVNETLGNRQTQTSFSELIKEQKSPKDILRQLLIKEMPTKEEKSTTITNIKDTKVSMAEIANPKLTPKEEKSTTITNIKDTKVSMAEIVNPKLTPKEEKSTTVTNIKDTKVSMAEIANPKLTPKEEVIAENVKEPIKSKLVSPVFSDLKQTKQKILTKTLQDIEISTPIKPIQTIQESIRNSQNFITTTQFSNRQKSDLSTDTKELKESKHSSKILFNSDIVTSTSTNKTILSALQTNTQNQSGESFFSKHMEQIAATNKNPQIITTKQFQSQLNGEIKEITTTTASEGGSTQEKNIVSHETILNQLNHPKIQTQDVKRTLNTFAQDFKEKVDNYKAPLMKINMQLNPGNLGDVDVTLITRGNNLQVNINSNPNTIALFTLNQGEFKNALVNMGFTGLQMNFGENKDGQQRGQNHKSNNRQIENYEEEKNEIDSFEMIVPRYI